MAEKTISQNKRKVLNIGMHDALIDGNVVHDIPTRLVFVSDENELDSLTDCEPVGTIAVQYGFGSMWQLTPDATWEPMWEVS